MVDSRMLLRCIHPLIFIFITKTKTNFTDKDKDSFKPQGLSKDHKLGDGCYHIFLDVGSNIGVHTRFLYEPDLYPDAKTSISIFEKEFGVHRNNTDFCAFGFEPNPAHENRHKMLMNEYDKMGWRYYYIQAGVSDEDGYITFYRQGDQAYEEWGFTSNHDIQSNNGLVNVSTIRLATWLRDEIVDRKRSQIQCMESITQVPKL